MNRAFPWILVAALAGCGHANPSIDSIESLGGHVGIDSQGHVRNVDFAYTDITDSALVHLEGLQTLESLELHGTRITDAGLEELKGLTNLRYLDIRATHVTDAGVLELQAALPDCRINR